jgi:hypothetical protein
LGYNTFFFFAIIIFLAIKIVLLSIALIFCRGEQPLLTIGDTMVEYLKDEDQFTKDSCLQLQQNSWKVIHAELRAAAPRSKSKLNNCIPKLWRMVYPGNSAASTDTCLSEDILSYSHRGGNTCLARYLLCNTSSYGCHFHICRASRWVGCKTYYNRVSRHLSIWLLPTNRLLGICDGSFG